MSEMHLQGAKDLQKIMEAFGGKVALKAGNTGVRKGALIMKRELKRASPVYSGILSRREWMVKKLRSQRRAPSAAYVVRLRRRFYYEVLEMDSKRGPATHPFALAAMERAGPQVVATIMAATKTAIAVEAGKSYARSKRRGR